MKKIGIYTRSGLLIALLSIAGSAAWAGSVCPAPTAPLPYAYTPDPSGTGCNVILTVNSNGTVTVTLKDANPYDLSSGGDDTLIGVVNNSSSPVGSVNLSGNDIFGFESDGICTFTFVGSSYCTASQVAGTDPGDYQGPTSTFTVTDVNTGRVNFSPGVPAGGSTYFSLEGLPTASLTATVGPTGPTTTVPTLSTWGLLMLAGLLMAYSARTIWAAYHPQA